MSNRQLPQNQSYSTHFSKDWAWNFWFTLPLYPFGQRRTLRTEVVKDTLWTFDQMQGIFYVVVPIRMTVVKLAAGGLLIYAPVAPTPECIRLINELVAQHGAVKYIILPTVSGLEHKIFVGPFARQFPQAQVYVAPHQWSFPLNLPLSWLGLPLRRTHVLPENSREAPFADEFDYAILGPIALGLGPFAEVAFFHKRSNSLLVTDSVISIPESPPAIVQLDPYPLLFHARDTAVEPLQNTEANRRKGWQRICLFSLYFRPSVLHISNWSTVWQEARTAPDRSRKAYFGLYPFQWQSQWKQSFNALHNQGQLLVAPILQTLILNRAPEETIDWANWVSTWDFRRIVPCHFHAPITASPQQFRQAFTFLENSNTANKPADINQQIPPNADFTFLKQIETQLEKRGITPPAKG